MAPGALGSLGGAALPRPLADDDAERYRRIFQLQEMARWAEADREVARLKDGMLLGHVLAQRYLSPVGYPAKFSELSYWLDRYADHPEATRIYELALKRKLRGAPWPRPPEGMVYNIPPAHAEIASGLYIRSQDGAAAFADAATAGHVNAAAERAGGLAAWRLGHYDQATRHFERLATAQTADSWARAAGAYWAARGHLVNGEPDKVTHWLDMAAGYPYTFYGILARRLAGRPAEYNWELPAFPDEEAARIMSVPAGARAFALVEVGEVARAERELRRVNPARQEMAHALLALSQRADMPSLAMQVAAQIVGRDGRRYDAALYPLPSWAPRGGFNVDPALVFALIRQESMFSARAESRVGARGLMQLMPRTARFVSNGTLYGGRRYQLFDPEINLTLGQNYLGHLMSIGNVGENLFLIAAAYNGGPGNVARWQRKIGDADDPLLFLEGIPKRETRQYVEHVIANYWIYLDQLGQLSPALDAIAQGQWPIYKSAGE